MRPSAILPAILTVFMLCTSCAEAACRIACGGAPSGIGVICTGGRGPAHTAPAQTAPAHTAPAHTAPQMADMWNCPMCKPMQPCATASRTANPCACMVESAASSFVREGSARFAPNPEVTALDLPADRPPYASRSEKPPIPIASPVTLRTTLRV